MNGPGAVAWVSVDTYPSAHAAVATYDATGAGVPRLPGGELECVHRDGSTRLAVRVPLTDGDGWPVTHYGAGGYPPGYLDSRRAGTLDTTHPAGVTRGRG